MAWFKDWFGTPYYALLYGHRDEADARLWADLIIGRLGLRPGDQLLDLACGRGRHAAHFAAAGLRVTGVDLSAPSIAEARQRVPEAEFHVHDIREPFAQERFDAVVCLFTSLGYSLDRGDDQRAVDAAARALKPDGAFVLDLLNGEHVRHTLVPQECLDTHQVRFTITRSLDGGDIVKHIQVDDRGCMKEFKERVHAWRVDEVEAMVRRSGLRIEAITDGPDPRPFDPAASERIVVWARLPGGQARLPDGHG